MVLCILNIYLDVYIIIGLKIQISFYGMCSNLYCIDYIIIVITVEFDFKNIQIYVLLKMIKINNLS